MKKLKSIVLTLAMISALGLVFQPTSVHAEEGGPQNTSNSQSKGGSSLTFAQVVAIIASAIRW